MPWLTNCEKALQTITAVTVVDAIQSPSPIIAVIAVANKSAAKATLVFLINDVLKFLNIGKTMDVNQVVQTADLILQDLETKNLKPDDFKVCFENGKKGLYGKVFDRLDGQIIFEWLRAYCNERMNTCEQLGIKKHTDVVKTNLVHPDVIEMYKAILKETEKVEPTETKPIVKRSIEKSPRDLFIQKCFTEFYQKWLKTPFKGERPIPMPGMEVNDNPAGRFIMYNGPDYRGEYPAALSRPVDEVEYVELKVAEYDQSRLEL